MSNIPVKHTRTTSALLPTLPVEDGQIIELSDTAGWYYDSGSTRYELGSGSGHVIENPAGTDMTQRANMQFVDSHLADDSTNDRTKIETIKSVTSAQFDTATEDGLYNITDGTTQPISAEDVGYDNTTSGLTAADVQDAIDELAQGGGGSGHTIEDASGTDLPQEDTLQFADSHVSDDSTNGRTVVENVKEVTLAELEQATERGMYLATDEESVPIGEIEEDVVSVTADGVKTWAQLLNELYAKIDRSKLNINSTIVTTNLSNVRVFFHISIDSPAINRYLFYTIQDGTEIQFNTLGLKQTDSFRNKYLRTTYTDESSDVEASGYKITLYYGSSSGIVELNTDARHCMLSDGVTSVESAIVPSGYSTDGLTFTDCTLVNGGYFKIGKMAVLNIRVKVTASSSVTKAYINLPNKIMPSTTLIGLTAQQSTDDLPPIFSVISIGKIFMKNTTDNKDYVISGTWLA